MSILSADYSNLNHGEMAKKIGLKVMHMPIIINSFLQESTQILQTISEAIQAKDYSTIKSKAHSLKGSAGNLRFSEIYEMSKDMELSAADTTLDFEYKAYLEAIKKIIVTIPN